MSQYQRNFRSCPLAVALVMPPLYVWFIWPALHDGWPAVWQLGPIMALFTYGMLFAFVNRVHVIVKPRGVWMRKGPLPVAPQTPPVLREHIANVYVRRVVYYWKGARVEHMAAGVQRMDGACLDITEEHIPEEAVRQHASAIADALEWPYPIVEIEGDVQNLESPVLIAYLGWAALLMMSLVWVGISGALQLGAK